MDTCIDKKTDEKVAIKIMKKLTDQNEGVSVSIIREVGILKRLSHENIIKLRDNYEDQKDFYLVLEYVDGDLR